MSQAQRIQVADTSRVERTLDRLAAQIDAAIPEELLLLGIRRRGVPLAEKLARLIEQKSGRQIPVAEVTVKRYADDLSLLHQDPELLDSELPEWEGTIVIVDDVLYTGRSLLRVLTWMQPVAAKAVYSAVLCSRDAREVPVRADFIGMKFDMGEHGIIDVRIPPYEDELAVWLALRNDDK
jgi:pyrimidine operon attenuation protein/uracil phosphoribosyltransferase